MQGRRHLLFAALAAGSLARCGCDETTEFAPDGRYFPETCPLAQRMTTEGCSAVLDFGDVSVSTEKTLHILVRSSGSAPLSLDPAQVVWQRGSADVQRKFTIMQDMTLTEGLALGQTATITITYRPCPDAWDGAANTIKEGYDLGSCPSALDSLPLKFNDNTNKGPVFEISGQPVQAPVLELACPRGSGHCNEMNPDLTAPCISLVFGAVNSGSTPCDLEVEIRNKLRGGKPTGALTVERFELLVYDINDTNKVVREGREIGFSVLDEDGDPIELGETITVPIELGKETGSKRVKVRFNGATTGTWRGQVRDVMLMAPESGLRIYSDDPDKRPLVTVPLSGTGSAPEITVTPQRVEFGRVPMGSTRTATLTVTNAGDATLNISNISLMNDTIMSKFHISTTMGMPPFDVPPNQRFEIRLQYTPVASGLDADKVLIGSNDINDNPLEVPVTGGAVPKIQVEPADTLTFALPNPAPPPPLPPREEIVTLRNVGYGDLHISKLEITGLAEVVDDFTITECSGQASCVLSPPITLCTPAVGPSCTSFETQIHVVYRNNDASSQDLAELRITSDDPTDPNHIVVLNAQDVPCFPPTSVVTVEPGEHKVGQEIRVNGRTSDPGGASGMGMIVGWEWVWIFTPGMAPPFTSQGTSGTSFFPTRQGIHVIGLYTTNNCGARSPRPGTDTITVQPM